MVPPIMSARIWLALPDHDFEPGEASIPWRTLTRAGHKVVITTEKGAAPEADPRLLKGVLLGKMGASDDAKAAYAEMQASPEYKAAIAWSALDPAAYDGLLLPGGHAAGMRPYLESTELRAKVRAFWQLDRPVAAICHGVLVLARAIDPATGKSILASRRTTCLPKYMELAAYYSTFWKLGRYYRTYDITVEDEVKAALSNPRAQFERGPFVLTDPAKVGDRKAFVVEDGRYVSGRWPGDAKLLAMRFLALVEAHLARTKGPRAAQATA
jgi:putative intracellular protease/amidase